MKTQIEKVCIGLSVEKLAPSSEKFSFSHDDQKYGKDITIKNEPSDELIAYNEHLNDPNQDVLYNKNFNSRKPYNQRYSHGSSSSHQYQKKFASYNNECKINPKNQFSHTMSCNFCNCWYHLFAGCPYKPKAVNLCDHQQSNQFSIESENIAQQQYY